MGIYDVLLKILVQVFQCWHCWLSMSMSTVTVTSLSKITALCMDSKITTEADWLLTSAIYFMAQDEDLRLCVGDSWLGFSNESSDN